MINGTQNVPTNDFPLKTLPNVNQPITKIGILIRNCVNAGLNSYISNKMVLTPDMPPAASLAGNKNILYPKPTRDAPIITCIYSIVNRLALERTFISFDSFLLQNTTVCITSLLYICFGYLSIYAGSFYSIHRESK